MFFCLPRRMLLSFGFFVLLCAGLSGAGAFEGHRELAEYTIQLPGPDGDHPFTRQSLQQQAVSELNDWSLSWVAGRDGSLTGIGPVATLVSPSQYAASFVSESGALLGMSGNDLRETGVRSMGHLEHRYYQQLHRGLPVAGSRLNFTFSTTGEPLQFTIRTAPEIRLVSLIPGVDVNTAKEMALGDLPVAGNAQWDHQELMVLPAHFSGLGRDRLVWSFYCTTMEPISAWRFMVDAQTGDLLERESLMTSLTGVNGSVSGSTTFPTPFDPETITPLGDMTVSAYDGEAELGSTVTDRDGRFDFGEMTIPDSENFTLQATLAGPWVSVRRHSIGDLPAVLSGAGDQFPADMVWTDSEATLAERCLFWNVNSAHLNLKLMEPGFMYLDRPVTVIALSNEGECNAYASLNPYSPLMTYFAAGEQCPNIGQITDVVYHEYAHLITMFTYLPDPAPGDFHEGFSDYFAATIMDTCQIGLGFTGENSFLRDLLNDRTESNVAADEYCSADEHCVGLLSGGALWDMRTALIAEIGDRATAVALADSLFHYCRYGHPMNFDQLLLHLRLVDDDDSDLSNGTPHLASIVTGFEHHEIADLGVHIAHSPLYDTEDSDSPRTVTVSLSNVFPVVSESIIVYYSVDGGDYISEQMSGSIWDYAFDIPAPDQGEASIRYYFTAEDEAGNTATLPGNAPTEYFSYFVGVDLTGPEVSHVAPVAPTESQPKIWFHAGVTDNSGEIENVTAEVTVQQLLENWSRSVPLNRKLDTEGGAYFEGALPVAHLSADDEIHYHLIATDGASGANQTRYPVEGEIGLLTHRGRSWDFEQALEGLVASGDWILNNPPIFGPVPASGTGLVETDAGFGTGQYNIDLISELITPPIDLGDWSAAQLVFDHWYQIEADWDGGLIECTGDGGESWQIMVPAGGYPGSIYDSWDLGVGSLPAFTGNSDGWENVVVPLDFYVGETIQIKFTFWSDGGVIDLGWYLDNLKVLESQGMVQPSQVSATQGDDSEVSLSWLQPTGINSQSDQFLGFNVYRAIVGEAAGYSKLNDSILTGLSYTDPAVTNGTYYNYAVTTVYSIGESLFSPLAVGYPYRAELAVDASAAVTVSGDPVSDGESIEIGNDGTGNLNVNVYLADPEDTFFDILPQFTPDGLHDESYTVLVTDEADADSPDLASIAVREDLLEGRLTFKFAIHDSTPDPAEDFTLVLGIDTDLDRATGMPIGATGSDFAVLLGRWAYEITGGYLPALTISGDGQMIGMPYFEMTPGADSLIVGLPSYYFRPNQSIGIMAGVEYGSFSGPPSVSTSTFNGVKYRQEKQNSLGSVDPAFLATRIRATLPEEPDLEGDLIPDERESTWLQDTQPRFGIARPDLPLEVALAFDFSGEIEGDFDAKLILTTNDPDTPESDIQLLVHLRDVIGEQMSTWSTESRDDGLLLEWSPVSPSAFPGGFELTRWGGDLENEENAILLTGAAISAPDDSLYFYLDRTAASGESYYYRITGITAEGTGIAIDPIAHPLYDPAVPGKLLVQTALPNPMRFTTTLRLQAPAGRDWDLIICDVTGRIVRQLVKKGVHNEGIHLVQWDGRDMNDEMVSQGVYYAVMRSGGKKSTRSLVVVR